MKLKINFLTILTIYLIIISQLQTEATLGKSDKKKTNKTSKVSPSIQNVYERNLVSVNMKASDILKEHKSYCEMEKQIKKFQGATLAYVTPWNNHGYVIAKLFSHKFTYVSPVWLQLVTKGYSDFEIKGKHDINIEWMTDVSRSGNALIVPRIIFDGWNINDYQRLFNSEKNIFNLIEVIVDLMTKKRFDGIVLEFWSQLMGRYKQETIHFIGSISQVFREFNKKLILVLPPPIIKGNVKNNMVTREDFKNLAPIVDAFSLMTYDYSDSEPGPNSPLNWIKQCIELLEPEEVSPWRKKILLGLNMYGYHYSTHARNTPILGHEYLKILQNHKPKFSWEENSSEHYLKYKSKNDDNSVYYPSLYSIHLRIHLASKMGVGVSIWEIGQGLDYFYDLF